jgi:hypothetical protein
MTGRSNENMSRGLKPAFHGVWSVRAEARTYLRGKGTSIAIGIGSKVQTYLDKKHALDVECVLLKVRQGCKATMNGYLQTVVEGLQIAPDVGLR